MDSKKSDTLAISGANSFVGRSRELDELLGTVQGLSAGRGNLFCLVGEPGIGKTRLAEEAAAHASGSGARVFWGRCWEGSEAPPYWPFIQIIRECAAMLDANALDALLPSATREMLGIARTDAGTSAAPPDAPTALSLLPARTGVVSGASRFALFDSVAMFFKRTAATTPLVIVLDDIHAADIGSLMLLRFLARDLSRTRILIVATYRELDASLSSERSSALASLANEGRMIRLQRLARVDIEAIVKASGLVLDDENSISALYEATEGNPFFLHETLRLLAVERGSPRARVATGIPVPDSVRETIERKLTPVSAHSREILEIAALIGKEFDVRMVAQVSVMDLAGVLPLIEELTNYNVISPARDFSGRYYFRHEMIRETIADAIAHERRMRLHLKIAGVLENIHADSDLGLAEIAGHYRRSLPLGSWEKVVDLSRRAAALALRKLAYEEAVQLLQNALDALSASPRARPEQACELLIEIGDALSLLGRFERQEETYSRVVELARQTGRKDLLARAALGLGIRYGTAGPEIFGLVGLLEEALTAIGEDNLSTRAMLKAKLAATLYWSQGNQRSAALSAEAVETARRANDLVPLIYALWRHHYSLWGPDNLDERLAIADELVDLSSTAGIRLWTLRAHEMLLADCLELGDFKRVEAACRTYAELEHLLGISDPLLDLLKGMDSIMRGDFSEGELIAERALAAGEKAQHPGALLSYTSQIAMIRFEQGRLGELEPMLKAYSEQFPVLDVLRCGIALSCIQSGRDVEARAHFEHLARDDFRALRRDWNWLGTMAVATEVCVFLEDRERAAQMYQLLLPYESRLIVVGWCEVTYGIVARYLGMLARLLHRYDDAERHFEAALTTHVKMGARPLLAHTQYEYARMLCEHTPSTNQRSAKDLVAAAVATADLLGMNSLGYAVRSLRRKLTQEESENTRDVGSAANAGRRGARTVVTVLFVDVVESTQTAAKLGDEKWRDRLAEFYSIVRRSLAEYGGREITNPGDGFLAVFDAPQRALAAACAIRNQVHDVDMRVRSGLHTGECEWIGEQAVGIAIHIGARVASAASPDEVLVSSTVREVVSGSSYTLSDAGLHTLKGVAEQWRLYRLE